MKTRDANQSGRDLSSTMADLTDAASKEFFWGKMFREFISFINISPSCEFALDGGTKFLTCCVRSF